MMPLLASAADDGLALWDGGHDPRLRFAPHSASVSALQWTANDRVLASGSLDGAIVLSEPDGALFDTLRPAPGAGGHGPSVPVPVLAVTWSPASRYLASGSADALVRIFDLQKREHALTLRGQRSGVCGLSWSPSEVHVASASALGEVLVHRVQGSVAAVCRAPAAEGVAVRGVHWCPFHPSKLAAASDDGVVSLWDMTASARPVALPGAPPTPLPSGMLMHKFSAHAGACCGVAWSRVNHHLLVSAAADGSVVFYDSTRLAVVRTIRADGSPLTALAFAADGLHIACGNAEGTVRVYDLRSLTETPLWARVAHEAPVTALAFQRTPGGVGGDTGGNGGSGGGGGDRTAGAAPGAVSASGGAAARAGDRAYPRSEDGPSSSEVSSRQSPAAGAIPNVAPNAAPAAVCTAAPAANSSVRALFPPDAAPADRAPAPASSLNMEPDYSSRAFASPHAARSAAAATGAAAGGVGGRTCEGSGPGSGDIQDQNQPSATQYPRGGERCVGAPAASAASSTPAQGHRPAPVPPPASISSRCRRGDGGGDGEGEAREGPERKGACVMRGPSAWVEEGQERGGQEKDGQQGDGQRGDKHSGFGLTQGGLPASALAALDGAVIEIRAALRDEIRNVQIELIRGLEAQRHEVRQMLEEGRAESSRLREENAALREENARLRAPLGAIGLQRWEGVA